MSADPKAQGLLSVGLRGPDGAQARILLQGAQLLSWMPVDAGEQLYLSPASVLEAGRSHSLKLSKKVQNEKLEKSLEGVPFFVN